MSPFAVRNSLRSPIIHGLKGLGSSVCRSDVPFIRLGNDPGFSVRELPGKNSPEGN